MNKINGYTEEEAIELVKYINDGKKAGKTLSGLFAGYAQKSGRAKGSVRNYYYALLRSTGDERVKNMLRGTDLKAEKIMPFTEAETDRILKEILTQKSRGVSVRRAVLNLSGGDDKLMLRYQNKYRNVVSKQPERIERLRRECGLPRIDDEVRVRLEDEINGLYERLQATLKEENKRLTTVIKRLTDENALLKLQLKNS
ncbi:MAG: hypothetical protein K2I20_06595 [Clostridia bacterium]|nr:hypothetical protein [Clostridia bacterium]MDE6356585.1 hypothetical protein [Clostridia bacterium]MDE7214773.1 hypothetical protein [Clostridia bacterium]